MESRAIRFFFKQNFFLTRRNVTVGPIEQLFRKRQNKKKSQKPKKKNKTRSLRIVIEVKVFDLKSQNRLLAIRTLFAF